MLFDTVDVVFLCLLTFVVGWFVGYKIGVRDRLARNIRYMIAGLIKRDVQ